MKWFNNRSIIFKYLICVFLLFIFLVLAKLSFAKPEVEIDFSIFDKSVTKSNIYINGEDKYVIDVNYPKFKDKKLNELITNWVYNYIKEFKEEAKDLNNNQLIINYSIYYIEEHANIFFDINNTLKPKDINNNILINLKSKDMSNIAEIYNEEILKENISKVKNKYPSFVSSKILNEDIDKFNYLITDDGYIIYFTNLDYSKSISYIPNIKVNLNVKSVEEEFDKSKKMVALTFDDGPSGYTLEILDCLELNGAKATFFELGSKMKKYSDITKKLYTSGMEIGNHSYSHKYLTRISLGKALDEINSTSIIFNQITNDNLSLLRPPYGSVNSTIRKNSPFPLIFWSIDTKDWLYRDANISAPIVLDNVKDGDIILMHDVHFTTIELVKIVVPELISKGYELVTVSELAKYKNYTLAPGVSVREIK